MNGFILVFDMVLVLAVERRFAADRAAAGGPARSRQSRPVAECPARSRRPRLWSGTRPQPVTPPPVGGGSPVAGCLGARRWQNAREMRSPGVRQWQDIAAVRSRAAIRGGFFASCVPEGASDGKSAPSWQHIAAVHPKRAGFGKIFAPCIRKAPQTGVRGCTARISCQEGAPFAARAPQIMHGAQTLPSFGARRALGLMRGRLGPGRVTALRIVADGPARRHGISLRSAAAAYPAANASPCGTLRPTVTIPCRDRPALFRSAAASHDPAHKKRPAFCWPFLRGYELSADYSARSFRRRSSSSASWWRLTLPDSVIGMASMNSMCSGRRRLATPMESRYSAMESSVGSTSPV